MKSNWFHQWIFESYNPSVEGLALFRIFASMLTLFFLMPDAAYYAGLASFPDGFYTPPPGPMMFFESFPPAWFFYTIHSLLVLSWIGILVGFKTRLSSIAAAVFMLMLFGFIFSIGKVNHQLLIVILPAIMAFSNWGDAYSIYSKSTQQTATANGWPLTLLALFIGFMMFTAGFPKLLGGWLSGDTFAAQGHLFNQYFMRGRTELLSGYMVNLNVPLIWGALDYATVFFEMGFLIAAFRAGWTRLFVCFAVMFHFSTMMTLNIAFLVNFPAYAAFLPWTNIHDFLKRRVFSSADKHYLPVLFGGVLLIIFGIIKTIDKLELVMSDKEPSFDEIVLIGTALLIVLALGAQKGYSYIRSINA